jgi:hypothetical protein
MFRRAHRVGLVLGLLAASFPGTLCVYGQDAEKETKWEPVTTEDWVRISPEDEVWLDLKEKRVAVGGQVCLTRGFLEMFACPRGTKEHESIVSLNSKAYPIHAGLLAIGAKPGHPVKYQPEYIPAEGPVIQVLVQWKDDQGQTRVVPAQHWVRHVKTGKQMPYDWVFAGSGFWRDEFTGEETYYAEGGEVICLSNFGTAMLDLPVASSQDNSQLLFQAFTERIPERETPVTLILSVQKGGENSRSE